jgi:hypothetical protein
MRTWDSPLRSVRSAVFLAGAAAVLLSANSVLNDFAFGDISIIVENTEIQDLSTLPKALISPYWPNEYGKDLGLWRPVATAFYGIQWAAWGENAAMFHLLNVLLHGVVTALVVLVLAELALLSLVCSGTAFLSPSPSCRGGGKRGGVGRGGVVVVDVRKSDVLRFHPSRN